MSLNPNQNPNEQKIASPILNIQILQKEFYLVTKQYEEAKTNYMNIMQKTQTKPYTILGISISANGGKLSMLQNDDFDGAWIEIPDNTTQCMGIATMNDGKGVLGISSTYELMIKTDYTSNWQPVLNSGYVNSVSVATDGTIVGVGLDYKLYTRPNLYGLWSLATNPNEGEWCAGVALNVENAVYAIGSDYIGLFKKNSYKTLATEYWQYLGNLPMPCQSLSFTPDDTLVVIGKDNDVYTNSNYRTNLQNGFVGPRTHSCCVVSVAFISNTNRKYGEMKGKTFWGSGNILKTVTNTTMGECEALCSSDPLCSGATFNPSDHDNVPLCWTVSGDGVIGGGIVNDYALVPELKMAAQQTTELNQKLDTLANQIKMALLQTDPVVQSEKAVKDNQKSELQNIYSQLLNERQQINTMLDEYTKMEREYTDDTTHVEGTNSMYFLWAILALVIMFVCIRVLTVP